MRGLAIATVLFVSVLSGCSTPTDAPVGSPTPTSTADTLPEQDGISESAGCQDPTKPEGCVIITEVDCHPWEFAASGDPEAISGWKQQIPEDSGPMEFAMGEVVLNADGVPGAYIVAAGDIPDFVAERFCVNVAYLNNINGVRRMGAMQLFVGDTINLDAHTILTVGDQNGEVFDNQPPDPMPPQH